MFKRLLYALFVTDRIKFEPNQMTLTFLILYFVSFWIALAFGGSLVAATLFCFVRAVTWISIAWLWADILWLAECSLLRGRRKYP